jgi:Helitron helicase-like domain at N-terminus
MVGSDAIMSCCGMFDVEGSTVSAERKFHQALQGIYIPHTASEHNLLPSNFPSHYFKDPAGVLTTTKEGEIWEIPSGSRGFANEYSQYHFPRAFPTLFPYGMGGIGADVERISEVSYERQVEWMMRQSHARFATHEVFMFVVFNTLQRRKICLGAKLMTSHQNLSHISTILRGLDYAEVSGRLESDINSGKTSVFSDPELKKIMSLTSIANSISRGSREYVNARRNEIRGMFVRYGGPHFFLTINPDDSRHSLIVALKNQEEQDIFKTVIPLTSQAYNRMRCKIVAENPVLQAEFFDRIFQTVMDVLIGFSRESKIGILGKVSAYYAMIEAQGKGTLHAHGLIWLEDGISNEKTVLANEICRF